MSESDSHVEKSFHMRSGCSDHLDLREGEHNQTNHTSQFSPSTDRPGGFATLTCKTAIACAVGSRDQAQSIKEVLEIVSNAPHKATASLEVCTELVSSHSHMYTNPTHLNGVTARSNGPLL